jgi:hypothetical protein
MSLILWSNVCIYMGLDLMVIHDRHNRVWLAGYYNIYIISSMSHPRSNSVEVLMLWTVVCNSRGTNIVLQVLPDNADSTENK